MAAIVEMAQGGIVPDREDRLFAAARDAMASVANRTVDDFSYGETGGGCGSEDLGTLRGTIEPIRPAGHRFDGEPVVTIRNALMVSWRSRTSPRWTGK